MIERICIISLIITGIHMTMQEGMIFEHLGVLIGNTLDRFHMSILRKPIYECLICMGGLWTVILYVCMFGISWELVPMVPAVIGLNSIISSFIKYIMEYGTGSN